MKKKELKKYMAGLEEENDDLREEILKLELQKKVLIQATKDPTIPSHYLFFGTEVKELMIDGEKDINTIEKDIKKAMPKNLEFKYRKLRKKYIKRFAEIIGKPFDYKEHDDLFVFGDLSAYYVSYSTIRIVVDCHLSTEIFFDWYHTMRENSISDVSIDSYAMLLAGEKFFKGFAFDKQKFIEKLKS